MPPRPIAVTTKLSRNPRKNEGGADLTLRAFTKLGVGLVPVQVAAAWVGLLATGALRRADIPLLLRTLTRGAAAT